MKNKVLFFVFFLFGMLLAGNVCAQEPIERSTQTTKIGGKEYYLHHVKAGQTLYGLSQAYNITIEEIEAFNPEVKDGLKAGHVLGIPMRPVAEPKEEPKARPTRRTSSLKSERSGSTIFRFIFSGRPPTL